MDSKHEGSETKPSASTATANRSVPDDNLMAALAHAGVLITVIVALVIWLTQEKSKYVEFQAKQALVYQLLVGVVLAVLWVIIMILGFLTMGIGFLLTIPLMLLGLVAVIYGLYAAYQTYQGKDFRYVIIGDMLAK